MGRLPLLVPLIVFSAALHLTLSVPAIVLLSDRYHYIIVGSDNVARSLGLHLAQQNESRSVLVLQTNQCDDILEPDQFKLPPAAGQRPPPTVDRCDQNFQPNDELDLWGLNVSNKFAECTQQLGYEFVDPLLISSGSRVGCAYKNRTCSLDREQQTLLAIDPNLQLLTGARVNRLLFNYATSSVLGVELELNGSKQYIYVEDEVIIAGRCFNDYKHLVVVSIMGETALVNFLKAIPLELSLGSPLLAPILYTSANLTIQRSPTLLATELLLCVADHPQGENCTKPNARLRLIVGYARQGGYLWLGFIPSIHLDDPQQAEDIPSYEQSVKMLSSVVNVAAAIINSSDFEQLNFTQFNQSLPECAKFRRSEQFWTCFIDTKLKAFEKKIIAGSYKVALLNDSFMMARVKALRLLPLGLAEPFLGLIWHKLFPIVGAQATLSNPANSELTPTRYATNEIPRL